MNRCSTLTRAVKLLLSDGLLLSCFFSVKRKLLMFVCWPEKSKTLSTLTLLNFFLYSLAFVTPRRSCFFHMTLKISLMTSFSGSAAATPSSFCYLIKPSKLMSSSSPSFSSCFIMAFWCLILTLTCMDIFLWFLGLDFAEVRVVIKPNTVVGLLSPLPWGISGKGVLRDDGSGDISLTSGRYMGSAASGIISIFCSWLVILEASYRFVLDLVMNGSSKSSLSVFARLPPPIDKLTLWNTVCLKSWFFYCSCCC